MVFTLALTAAVLLLLMVGGRPWQTTADMVMHMSAVMLVMLVLVVGVAVGLTDDEHRRKQA